jgi:hypothetical protein
MKEKIKKPDEKLSFNSIEEMNDHFDQLIAYEKRKWSILYPMKISIEHLIYWIPKLKNKAIWAVQRIVRKHRCADVDIWDMDNHISKILLPKLEAFRNQKHHSYPSAYNSAAHCFLEEKTAKQDEPDKTDEGLEAWLNILDEIIYAFQWNVYASLGSDVKKKNAFYLRYFKHDITTLDDADNTRLKHNAADRAQKGFELFGKYFTSLWD